MSSVILNTSSKNNLNYATTIGKIEQARSQLCNKLGIDREEFGLRSFKKSIFLPKSNNPLVLRCGLSNKEVEIRFRDIVDGGFLISSGKQQISVRCDESKNKFSIEVNPVINDTFRGFTSGSERGNSCNEQEALEFINIVIDTFNQTINIKDDLSGALK